MGLIKAAFTSAGSALSDQWLDVFTIETMKPRDLMARGYKRHERGANVKSNEGVITNGSKIMVPEGVVCMVTDGGRVTEFVAEAGTFTYDSGTEGSFFDGNGFFSGLKGLFSKTGERIAMGGESGKDMRVYYVNIKEILDNPFGTPEPVPFEDPKFGVINLKYHGAYSFKIVNPINFVQNLAGTALNTYSADDFTGKVKAEFMTKLNEVINRLDCSFAKLTSQGTAIVEYMNKVLDEQWTTTRGIEIVSVGIQAPTLDAESRAKVDKLNEAYVMGSNQQMAIGRTVSASANAMESAASNTAGAMTGFMGFNMAQMAQGNAMGNLSGIQNAVPAANANPAGADSWTCSCGAVSTGKFCSECGAKMETAQSWKCECGAENKADAKFCNECGKKKE